MHACSPITVTAKQFSLDANGHTVTLDGGGSSRLFVLSNGANVTFTGLTFQHGHAASGGDGGAIATSASTLTVADDTFTDNTARYGGAIDNNGGGSTITVRDSTFTSNTATGGLGGAIHFTQASSMEIDVLTVTGSTFSSNSATGNFARQGSFGGAIENFATQAITNSTFVGNSAGTAGAVGNAGGAIGSITTSTLSSNSGTGALNSGGTFTVVNTIFDHNGCGSGTIVDHGYNLQFPSDTSCGFSAARGDQSGDPMLGALGANGGPTDTEVPAGAPAIDQVPLAKCPSTDQRGFARPDDAESAYDIDAVETGSMAGPPPHLPASTPELGSGELLATGLLPLEGRAALSPTPHAARDAAVGQHAAQQQTTGARRDALRAPSSCPIA